MVFHSEYADVPAVSLPIHDAVLGRSATAYGDAVALVDGAGGLTVTYGRLDAYHRRIAAALAEAGVRKDDVLALHSPNTVLYPAVFHAATRAGAAVSAVIGVYDADGNEVPKAYVVRQPGAADLTGDDIIGFVAGKVAPYKKIRRVEFVEGVPRAASGKILRRELRQRESRQRDREGA
ncbi:AMP-binding protein [Streptomyces sp. NPDC006368]|uniref:AMP-binding protein n=1 Tax=Streptomyces sp. NPDC006368 TaxID=3156760 RepID=UPI0033B0967A